jgi:hypothetical protein
MVSSVRAQDREEFILQVKSEHSIEQWFQAMEIQGGECVLKDITSERMGIYLISCALDVHSAEDWLEALEDQALTSLVQFNHHNLELRETEPNDGNYTAQWHLPQISAPLAWDFHTGDGMDPEGEEFVIAVIDEGFDLSHSDLNFFKNSKDTLGNGIDDDGNGYVDDYHGWNAYDDNGNITARDHGTGVSGIIGALGNNSLGVAGLNWNQKVLPIMGLSSDENTVVKAYAYLYEQRYLWNTTSGDTGIYIVATNSSFGVDRKKPSEFPIWCQMYDSLGSVGILNVAATANSSDDIDFWGDIPTTCPSDFLIAVTSTNRDDALSTSPSAARGVVNVDLGAPGEDIFTTRNGGIFGFKSGTSFATPVVTGALGLMYSSMCDSLFSTWKTQPDSLALMLRDYLLSDGIDKMDTLDNKVASGGRLNVHKAVAAVSECRLLSTDEWVEEEFAFHPNPSKGNLVVQLVDATDLRLLDLLGKELRIEHLSAGKHELHWEQLRPGLYLLNIGQNTYKWLVQE